MTTAATPGTDGGPPRRAEAVASAAPRVVLEPLGPPHAVEMFPLLSDPAIYTHLDYGPPASVEALHALYTRLAAGRSPDGRELWLNWLVRRRDDGRAAGYVQATVLPGRLAWVGYVFAPPHWGQGLATQAMQALLAHLAREHPVPLLLATVEVANTRSAALLSRLGFAPVAPGDAGTEDLSPTERLYRCRPDGPEGLFTEGLCGNRP